MTAARKSTAKAAKSKPAAKAAAVARNKQRTQATTAKRNELDGKRGAGRQLTDAQLLAYCKRVIKANPGAVLRTENEYAFWVEGIATGRVRFARIWEEAGGK